VIAGLLETLEPTSWPGGPGCFGKKGNLPESLREIIAVRGRAGLGFRRENSI